MFTLKKTDSLTAAILFPDIEMLLDKNIESTTTWHPNISHDDFIEDISHVLTPQNNLDEQLVASYLSSSHISIRDHTLTYLKSSESEMTGTLKHHGNAFFVAIKGDPIHIINICEMTDNEREAALIRYQALNEKGDYVIAAATGQIINSITSIDALNSSHKLQFKGLISIPLIVGPKAKKLLSEISKEESTFYIMSPYNNSLTQKFFSQTSLPTQLAIYFDLGQDTPPETSGQEVQHSNCIFYTSVNKSKKAELQSAIVLKYPSTHVIGTLEQLESYLVNK